MFFLIGGVQPKTILIDKKAKSCDACGHYELHLKRVDNYLSLFFIPLFPVKKGKPFLICENCKTVYDDRGFRMDVDQAEQTRRCPRCGRSISPDFRFCPYCGKSI